MSVTTTTLPLAEVSQEVIVNADGSTSRQTVSALSVQLASAGAVSDALAAKASSATVSDLSAAIESLTSTGIIGYATAADLPTDPEPETGSLAQVTNDPVAANNGIWRYDGSTWVQGVDWLATLRADITELEGSVAGLATDIADAEEAVDAFEAVITRPGLANIEAGTADDPAAAVPAATLAVLPDGSTYLTAARIGWDAVTAPEYATAEGAIVADAAGRAVALPGVQTDPIDIVDFRRAERIVIFGDSFTAGLYSLPGKAYVSYLSSLVSGWSITHYARPGDDALGIAQRIALDREVFGLVRPSSMRPQTRYAIIATGANDSYMINATPSGRDYWLDNLRRLVEYVRAHGAEPIIMSEHGATPDMCLVMQEAAAVMGCRYHDGSRVRQEMQGPSGTVRYYRGHPGPRLASILWWPALEIVQSLPPPRRGIKVFRRRAGVSPAGVADLLPRDDLHRLSLWREIDVAHTALQAAHQQYWDELDSPTLPGSIPYDLIRDEYDILSTGGTVTADDWMMLEITVDGTAGTVSWIELLLDAEPDCDVWVRDYYAGTVLPGVLQGQTASNSTYQAQHDQPVGGARAVTWAPMSPSGLGHVAGILQGDRVQIIIHRSGGVTLGGRTALRVHGPGGKSDVPRRDLTRRVQGPQLVTAPTIAPGLTGWTSAGSPTVYTPIDPELLPRDPDQTSTARVSHVAVVTDADTISQAVSIGAASIARQYILTIWARFNPPAFVDNSRFSFPAGTVIDRGGGAIYPDDSPVTSDTVDVKTIAVGIWYGASKPAAGAAISRRAVAMAWTPVEIPVSVPAWVADTIGIEIAAAAGAIEVASMTIREHA